MTTGHDLTCCYASGCSNFVPYSPSESDVGDGPAAAWRSSPGAGEFVRLPDGGAGYRDHAERLLVSSSLVVMPVAYKKPGPVRRAR